MTQSGHKSFALNDFIAVTVAFIGAFQKKKVSADRNLKISNLTMIFDTENDKELVLLQTCKLTKDRFATTVDLVLSRSETSQSS